MHILLAPCGRPVLEEGNQAGGGVQQRRRDRDIYICNVFYQDRRDKCGRVGTDGRCGAVLWNWICNGKKRT